MIKTSIYKEDLLKHYRDPKNLGSLKNPDIKALAQNPLCGDELELNIKLSERIISDCKTKVRGCSICVISASMMSELIQLKTLNEAENLRIEFSKCLLKNDYPVPVNLEYLLPLISLKDHRSRINCISLAWDALYDCLSQNKE